MTAPTYQWQPSTEEVARRAGIERSRVIRFDHNTSPTPPSWAQEIAARAGAGSNEYPAADYLPLRTAAAAYAGVSPDQVVAGAGADEMISLCARAFLEPGARSSGVLPGYTLYRIAVEQRPARYLGVPAPAPDFALPVAELGAAAARSAVTWICVPDNPTGRRDTDADLAAVIEAAAGIVVIDAAYAEFCGDRWSEWLDRFPHLIVLHTLSKAFGLAGIRVGYSLSSPELARRLDAIRPPGSISTISAALAIAALENPDRARATAAALSQERERLARGLAGLGFRVVPSHTNFLLCEVGPAAAAIERRLMDLGLVVRAYRNALLTDYLRFTVRTPPEDDLLLDALERSLP